MAAEDITEETFVKAWKAIGSCRGKERTFSAWLYRIAHNHLINTLRDNNKTVYLDQEQSVEIIDTKQELEAGADCQELLKEIKVLPESQRQVIVLKFIEGMDNKEISQITGKNEGTIRITQMRALAALRNRLGREQENGKEICQNVR